MKVKSEKAKSQLFSFGRFKTRPMKKNSQKSHFFRCIQQIHYEGIQTTFFAEN